MKKCLIKTNESYLKCRVMKKSSFYIKHTLKGGQFYNKITTINNILFQIKMFRKHHNRNGITSTSSEDEDKVDKTKKRDIKKD